MTGPKIVAAIPWTEKPGTIAPANQKQKPLMTKENNPRVRMLTGKDNTEMSGRIEPLIAPKTNRGDNRSREVSDINLRK